MRKSRAMSGRLQVARAWYAMVTLVLPTVLLASPVRAQGQLETRCELQGTADYRSAPLPGVAIAIRDRDRTIVSSSTDEEGRWRVRVPPGTYLAIFELRGFRAARIEITPAHCSAPLDVSMTIDAAATRQSSLSASMPRPPGDPTSVGATVLRGRAAIVNRAALRARQAAIARGEVTIGASAWPIGLAVITPPPPGTPAPLVTRALTIEQNAALPNVAQRVLAPSVVTSARLYSATTSYTVAGSALDSSPYQLRPDAPQPKPGYFRHSVDFTVGGPLALPRAFPRLARTTATLSYSAIRGGNLFDQYATVPTAEMRAGRFSPDGPALDDPVTGVPFADNTIPAHRLDGTAVSLLAFLPLPNSPGTRRNFHHTSTNRSTQDHVNLRLTRPIGSSAIVPGARERAGRRADGTPSMTLNGQVEYRRNVNDRLSALPAIGGIASSASLRVPVSLNMTRRNSQHSASAGYTRNTNVTTNRYADVSDIAGKAGIAGVSTDPFAWGVPTLSFATLTNVVDLTPTERSDSRLTFSYSWARSIAAHRVRMGAEVARAHSTSRTDANARGTFVFTGLYSGSDFADFLLGKPQQASVQYGPGLVRLNSQSISLYAQDEWRRFSNVTLNAGVRYELVAPYTEQDARLANLDVNADFTAVTPVAPGAESPLSGRFPAALIRTDRNNVAPRIGAAWRLASRSTLRVGYGVSFNTGTYGSLARQLAAQPPFAVTNTAIATLAQPLALTDALTLDRTETANTFGVARDYEAGTVRTWTVDFSRDIGDAWNASAGLTEARGSHLDIVRAPNRGPDGLRIPGVQPFLWQTAEGQSHLRSATLRLRRWYVRGWSLSANYTLARSMDNASNIGGGSVVVAQDEGSLAAEWGLSSFSRRHQFSGDLNFEFPFGDHHRWLNRGGPWAIVLGSMSAYITFSAQTGTPLTARVLSNPDDVARGMNGTLRAQLTGAPIAVTRPSADRFFNTGAFALPAPGTFGNAPRNVIIGPGYRSFDVQLARDIPSGGTRMLSVQVRVSNPFNLVNYMAVDTVVNSPSFGQVTSVRSMRSTQINLRWKF